MTFHNLGLFPAPSRVSPNPCGSRYRVSEQLAKRSLWIVASRSVGHASRSIAAAASFCWSSTVPRRAKVSKERSLRKGRSPATHRLTNTSCRKVFVSLVRVVMGETGLFCWKKRVCGLLMSHHGLTSGIVGDGSPRLDGVLGPSSTRLMAMYMLSRFGATTAKRRKFSDSPRVIGSSER